LEIIDALDHAHDQSVIHRDLKPSNVMLTRSGTKLLDFGLAKLDLDEPMHRPLDAVSRETLTQEGTILGTVEYMSPEQLQAKTVDGRTDIFSFGVLLFEMMTGRKPFRSDNQAGLMAAILHSPAPDLSAENVQVPHAFDHVVARCLAKIPAERWQTATDLKHELRWVADQPQRVASGTVEGVKLLGRSRVVWVGLALAVVATALWMVASPGIDERPIRVSVPLAPGAAIVPHEVRTDLAISPDGHRLAFIATVDGTTQLWVRSFESAELRPLLGTEGAFSPFWSPDSQFIGFATDGRLLRIDRDGGPPIHISHTPLEGVPSWGSDGTILLSKSLDGIYRVPADGGEPVAVTRLNESRGEVDHLWPHFLPDGQHFLYVATSRTSDEKGLAHSLRLASLDGREDRVLMHAGSRMEYVEPGFLMYVRDGVLLAHAFDAKSLRLSGEPMPLVDDLHYFLSAANAGFSASQSGVLAYHPGHVASRLVWFDRRGNELGTIGGRAAYGSVRIAPDGRRVAIEIVNPRSGTPDLWIHDVARRTSTRLTSNVGSEADPIWSPDGHQIIFRSDRDGPPDLYQMASAVVGSEQRLLKHAGVQRPTDWTSDGSLVAYTEEDRETGHSLWLLTLGGTPQPKPYLRTRFQEGAAAFSPDGRWLAFVSDESGRPEVYAAPINKGTAKRLVSNSGGSAPRWRHDGKELFYFTPDNRLMKVTVNAGRTFYASAPMPLFRLASPVGFTRRVWYASYDVSPDGERFLINVSDATPSSIHVVFNWTQLLPAHARRR
jgi:Tol biopolymer transport system component